MRLYRALLFLFPAGFRNEYATEMCAVFARKQRDSFAPLLWLTTIFDLFYNAALVHFDILLQDLSYTTRSLRRSPGFALTAIAVAALGIGATTAAFAMLDHVLLKPLPFAGQDRLMQIFEDHSFASGNPGKNWDMSPSNYRDWKQMSASFESMGCFGGTSYNMTGEGEPRRVVATRASADLLPVLGVKPAVGRWFSESDDTYGAPATVILSNALWHGAFGGELSVVGRKVLLDNEPHTVIGVMPPDFHFPTRNTQLWTTLRLEPDAYKFRDDSYLYGIGKLKTGVSQETAQAELSTIASQLEHQYPNELAHIGATVTSMRGDMSPESRLMIEALLAAAGCVLLVASMNLANLLLARAIGRSRELAVRTAIGAGRERLVRQMLTESMVLSIAGGLLGTVLAAAVLPLLVRLVPVYLPISEIPAVDFRFLLFALAVTSLTSIAFGLVPALRACRDTAAQGLREGARSGGGRRERFRSVLVLAEVAGSVVLLVCCALLIRALYRVSNTDPGFHAEGVLTARMTLPMPKYEKVSTRDVFYRAVLSKVAALPGVHSTAFISSLPMVARGGLWPVSVPDQGPQPPGSRRNASLRFVSPSYFQSMGIPLRSGRDVQESDSADSQFVALVSESFVKYYWPGQNPIGRKFDFGNSHRTVIGVVGDVKVRGLERDSEPQVYLPYLQQIRVSDFYAPRDIVIGASGNLLSLAPALREIVRQADPMQPVSDIRPMTDIVDGEVTPRRVQALALGSFAAIAFLLAAIGIHGLLSFSVSERTREIAVRLALGAGSGKILSTILAETASLTLSGIGLGCFVAYGAATQLGALLAGVTPNDWFSYSAAAVLCLLMALLGSLLPAMRAVRVDPAIAIRTE